MRKILLYTLMTLAAAGMASCEDFLTRDTYDQIGEWVKRFSPDR